MGPPRSIRGRIGPALESCFGTCFEGLFREALPFLPARKGVGAAFEAGGYRDRVARIDVVRQRDDGWIDLGECRRGPVRSVGRLEQEIEDKVARCPNPRNLVIGRRIFIRRPPGAAVSPRSGISWHTPDDHHAA